MLDDHQPPQLQPGLKSAQSPLYRSKYERSGDEDDDYEQDFDVDGLDYLAGQGGTGLTGGHKLGGDQNLQQDVDLYGDDQQDEEQNNNNTNNNNNNNNNNNSGNGGAGQMSTPGGDPGDGGDDDEDDDNEDDNKGNYSDGSSESESSESEDEDKDDDILKEMDTTPEQN